ncbi:hypothetical protein BGZ70_004038, partial [Mortierella alpina]
MLPAEDIKQANERFQALVEKVDEMQQTIIGLQAKVAAPESKTEAHHETHEFMNSNAKYFTSLTVNLIPKLQELDTEVKRTTTNWKCFQAQLELFFVVNESLYPHDQDRI